MAEEVPISETRRVVIQYEIKVPPAGVRAMETPITELAEAVRRELIRTGSRNPDIFGGRA